MIHADGLCLTADGYECHDGRLYGPRPEEAEPNQPMTYIARCYCPCHQEGTGRADTVA